MSKLIKVLRVVQENGWVRIAVTKLEVEDLLRTHKLTLHENLEIKEFSKIRLALDYANEIAKEGGTPKAPRARWATLEYR